MLSMNHKSKRETIKNTKINSLEKSIIENGITEFVKQLVDKNIEKRKKKRHLSNTYKWRVTDVYIFIFF